MVVIYVHCSNMQHSSLSGFIVLMLSVHVCMETTWVPARTHTNAVKGRPSCDSCSQNCGNLINENTLQLAYVVSQKQPCPAECFFSPV